MLKSDRLEHCLIKDIKFDGIRFWFNGECIGKICDRYRFVSPVPKDVMVKEKLKTLNSVMLADVI